MQIELGHSFFIDVEDGYNYTLKQRVIVTGENARGKKPKAESIGEEREKACGFYNSIEGAISKAIMLGLTDCNELSEARQLIKDYKKAIESAMELTQKLRSK